MEATQNLCEMKYLSDVLPPKLKDYIESIAKNNAFITCEVVVRNISANGTGYMGIIYEVDIKGETANGVEKLNIFVKNIPENEQIKIYSVSGVFRQEAFVYTDLSRKFIELQDQANIPDKERFQMAKSYKECNPKSIILEHLGKKGFKVYNRMETVSFIYAKLCIQQLGKFHALSMILQDKDLAYFKEIIVPMKEPFIFEEDWYGFVKNMYNYSINVLEPDVRKKVGDKILEKVDDYPKYINDNSGVCTFCHGDYKHNNVMVKEVNGKPAEVIPIDFQISHFGNPILDFLYFIFNGSDQEFRRNHLEELKDLYFEAIEKFLECFKIDVEKIFPRTEFERVFKEKLDFGLMINVFYVPFLFAVDEDAPDVANESLSSLSFRVDDRFTERFRGVVDDFIKWGYL